MTMARYNGVVLDSSGAGVAAHIEVRSEAAGQPLAALKSDRAGATPLTNPFDADADGSFFFHVVGGAYQVRAYTGSSGSPTFEKIWRYEAVGTAGEQDALGHVGIVVAPAGHVASSYADYVCGGAADEVEINEAIVAANAIGGKLLLLGGDYSVDGPIEMLSNVDLEGEPSTELIASTTFTTTSGLINCAAISNFSITGVGINLRTNNKGGNGIVCAPAAYFSGGTDMSGTPCSDYAIRGNRIKVRKGHAYHIWNVRSEDFFNEGNFIDGGYTSADTFTAISSSQEGIECIGAKGFSIINNRIDGVGNAGINLQSFSDLSTDIANENGVIAGNVVTTAAVGLLASPYSDSGTGETGGLKNISIVGNTFSEIYVRGLLLEIPTTSAAALAVPIYDLTISGNKFIGAAAGQPSDSLGFSINNQLTSTAIDFRNVKIAGNTIANWLPTSGAFVTLTNINNYEFSDNEVWSPPQGSGTGYGVALHGSADFQFDRNHLTGGRVYGLSVTACSDWSICDNLIKDWNGNDGGAAGIIVQASGAPVPSVRGRLQGNSFTATNYATVGSLISLDATTDEIDYLAPDNRYIGADYSGSIVTNASGNTFNRGVSAWSLTNVAVPDARYGRIGSANVWTAQNRFEISDNGASPAAALTVYYISASPAALDYMPGLVTIGRNSAAAAITYTTITSQIHNPTAGAEDSSLQISTMVAGASATRFAVSAGVYMTGATGGDLGVGTINATAVYDDNNLCWSSSDTTIPDARYARLGSANTFTGVQGLPDGSVSAPAWAFSADLNNGAYRIGTDNWALTAGGVKVMDFTASAVNISQITTISGNISIPLNINRVFATTAGPRINLMLDNASGTPAIGDVLGTYGYRGRSSTAVDVDYGGFRMDCSNPTNGSHAGYLRFQTAVAGSVGTRLIVKNGVYTASATGGDQGADSINAKAVYDDSVLLCAPIEFARKGSMTTVDLEKWDGLAPYGSHRKFKTMLDEGFDPRDPRNFVDRMMADSAVPGLFTETEHGQRIREGGSKVSIGEARERIYLAIDNIGLAVGGLVNMHDALAERVATLEKAA